KFRAFEPRPQITFQHELFERARRSARRVELKIVSALHLRAIECRSGCLQQTRRIAPVVRIETDADTARDKDLLVFEKKGLIERLLDGAGDIRGVLRPR